VSYRRLAKQQANNANLQGAVYQQFKNTY